MQKDGLEQRQHCSVFSSGEFGQGRYISNDETQPKVGLALELCGLTAKAGAGAGST